MEVGGSIDETGVSLAIYGEDLDPSELTKQIGVTPTSFHRRGDRKGPRSPPFSTGGWFKDIRGMAPSDPESLATELLDSLPNDSVLWAHLTTEYKVQLRFGLHLENWNREFILSPALITRIAGLGVSIVMDIYTYVQDDT